MTRRSRTSTRKCVRGHVCSSLDDDAIHGCRRKKMRLVVLGRRRTGRGHAGRARRGAARRRRGPERRLRLALLRTMLDGAEEIRVDGEGDVMQFVATAR